MKKTKSTGRRKFIADAAALSVIGAISAGHLLTSCKPRRQRYEAPVFPARAPDGPVLKAGLIGCGNRGTGAAFNFLDAGPNLEITALADVLPSQLHRCRQALKEHRGVEIPDENCFIGFDAYQKVIDSDVDIILETTLSKFRPAHFEAAVQARKHVFLEKPGSADPVGARTVMAAGRMAEAAGLCVVAGTQRRHQHDYVKTFSMIKNGAIGDLVSANCYWNRGGRYVIPRQEGWSDMEFMLMNQGHFNWLTGGLIVNLLIHQIDVFNWFFEKHPSKATGFGGLHRRPIGDMYDFYSVDYVFDDGKHYHAMTREIDGCSNLVSEIIFGTKGYTNCQNKIYDYDGKVIWEYEYPPDENGQPTDRVPISPYEQEHINFVTAIRTNQPVNEAYDLAAATLVCLMGSESAHTGQDKTWEDMMNSNLSLGPEEYKLGPVEIPPAAVPGTAAS